jgi:hypothetical protein
VTFIPLPYARQGNLAGLLSVTLPPDVRTGQTFRVSAQQVSGVENRILGGFQLTVPVQTDPEILPAEIDKLAVLRHIQQSIPATSRWSGIFDRYVGEIAGRVRGLGGDPERVKPSPAGGHGVGGRSRRGDCCPDDLISLNIPWGECEIEGELELRLRFHRKCE